MERLERQQRVADAVRALPEPYRSTLLYRYLDELPMRAVAERTGVPEATVRKRLERGLQLLRERLDGEFGGNSRAWALTLLSPQLRDAAVGSTVGWSNTALVLGAIMSGKQILWGVAALMVLSMAWWSWPSSLDSGAVEAGGRGVVVPASVAMAREPSTAVDGGPTTSRTPALQPSAATVVSVRGLLFVDEEHRAPADLEIRVERSVGSEPVFEELPQVHVDTAAASWRMDLTGKQALKLWITSSSTVPAQIPVPVSRLVEGGGLDLHLVAGRTLQLTLLDETTKAPLTALEFEVCKSIELQRGGGRIVTRGAEARYRTDENGKAAVPGIPTAGYLSVVTNFVRYSRSMVMANGQVITTQWAGLPVWSAWLTSELPLEQTILVRPGLGEASAVGVVPAWASVAGEREVRVVARQLGAEPRLHGDPFVLPQDANHGFELRAQAPARYGVWLERLAGRERLSAEAVVEFAGPGVGAPIVLSALAVRQLALRCRNVPTGGILEVRVSSPSAPSTSKQAACNGQPLELSVPMVAGDEVRLTVRSAADAHGKSGWSRQLTAEQLSQSEVTVDLAGSWCDVSIASDVVALAGEGVLSLMPCRSGAVVTDEHVIVLCNEGRGSGRVHVPVGQWAYVYSDGQAQTIWGVQEVTGKAGPLALVPRLHLVPESELRPAQRFDAIEGVSLRALPERLRTWRAPSTPAAAVAMPVGAELVRIEAPR